MFGSNVSGRTNDSGVGAATIETAINKNESKLRISTATSEKQLSNLQSSFVSSYNAGLSAQLCIAHQIVLSGWLPAANGMVRYKFGTNDRAFVRPAIV